MWLPKEMEAQGRSSLEMSMTKTMVIVERSEDLKLSIMK